ncbi:MAG TPA: DNA internalization-related competence protein ComEC/Rec2 [Candidatus Eisenbacteria bacterium]|nr:DNA internalization-related competence protein ComEC/Rec2 [Candidatus Eisenbacteria bacterium]
MKIPAVAMAAAFGGGLLLSRMSSLPSNLRAPHFLGGSLLAAFLFLIISLLLVRHGRVWAAAIVSLSCWCALGAIAMGIASRPLPAEHVLRRLAAGQLELKTPLRWYGTLRDEPARLPWGYGMDVELSGVEDARGWMALRGGMRLSFTPREGDEVLPEVQAGDAVSVLTQARLPLVFRDDGAFDRRAYLAQHGIDLAATLRASALLERTAIARPTVWTRVARLRAKLRQQVDAFYPNAPETAGVLRAMLLGDRSFVDRAESADYQKTGVFHVLVVAGLHVGALAFFVYWAGRKLRLPRTAATLILLATLLAYVALVEQRAPVLRAGLMAALVALAGLLYRRLEILNSAGLAALALLVAKPEALFDASFQFSFLAIGCIGGIALPWMERHVQPYLRALRGWRDVTQDGAFSARQAQFRMDLRDAVRVWMTVAGRFGKMGSGRKEREPNAETHRTRRREISRFGSLLEMLREQWANWLEELLPTGVRCGLWGAELVMLSVVLQAGMLPMMARDFHRVTLDGPAANLLVVPLTGVIVPVGFLMLGAGLAWPAIGRVLAVPLGWLVAMQDQVVRWFAGMGHGSYRIPGPPWWAMAVFFACGLAIAASLRMETPRWRWLRWMGVAGFAAAALVIATFPFPARFTRGSLEMDVLDVGQGDSILLVSPKGSTLLIDGGGRFTGFRGHKEAPGPDPGEEAVSAYLWSRGIQHLDAVALNHAHQDHIGGLAAVLENFRVGQLWIGRETETPALTRLKKIAAERHVLVEHELRGQSFDWDGVRVDFLWPETPPTEVAPAAKNNDSLVMRVQYKERSLLLPGDAEKQVEYAMLGEDAPEELHADVLKVGHHGSKNSTMPEFLERVGPRVAIISAGEGNPYGHPSGELLERLEERRIRILRTDEEGEISVVTDGRGIAVGCFAGCGGKAKSSPQR